MKLPEVERCCFCCPVRWGIIIFGYINLIFSMVAVACLVIKADPLKSMVKNEALEGVTSTVLFEILGMGVILNILLLVAGFKKDISMLRLYNFYALLTALAALVPTIILITQLQYLEGIASLLATAMQCYVIVLVRSEILNLEEKKLQSDEGRPASTEVVVDLPDTDALL